MTAGPFWTGDIPVEDLIVVPTRREETLDLEQFSDVDLMLFGPDRTLVPSSGFLATIEQGALFIEWPGESILTVPGVYRLVPVLITASGARERVDAVSFVVQTEDGWHTLESARAVWEQAPSNDLLLFDALATSRVDCLAYAPRLADGAPVPVNYRAAQLAQARNTLNANQVSPGGDMGEGSFSLTPFPLDWKVQALLRPKRGVPVVG